MGAMLRYRRFRAPGERGWQPLVGVRVRRVDRRIEPPERKSAPREPGRPGTTSRITAGNTEPERNKTRTTAGRVAVDFDASLLVIMAIFWATYVVVRVFLIGPVMKMLRERDSEIVTAQETFDRAQAEVEARIEAQREKLKEARVEAAARRDEMRREAQQARERMVAEARQEADAELQQAIASLEAETAEQRRILEIRAERLAAEMTAKLMGAPS